LKGVYYIKHIIGCLLMIFQLTSCKKTNWSENYKEKVKEPFGLYILHQEFEDLTGNDKTDIKKNFYDYIYEDYYADSTRVLNYFNIKNYPLKLNKQGIQELLYFVDYGNVAFLSCNNFPHYLKESLQFELANHWDTTHTYSAIKNSKGKFRLKNNAFQNEVFDYKGYVSRNYFKTTNENNTIVLGTNEIDGDQKPNFIKVYFGKGAFYLHSNPVAFSNYYLLNNNEEYVENALSYLPDGEVIWDLQIKSSSYHERKNRDESIFKFFLKHPTLTWFLMVLLTGLLLFMIFNARRKQRAIPIIEPLENSTVAFTQTISSLYLKEGDHKSLADKKIKFFLEQVRTKYLLDTNNLNTKFIENLALKSGNELQKTKYLINSIISINKKTECSEEELIVLYRMIDNFFKK